MGEEERLHLYSNLVGKTGKSMRNVTLIKCAIAISLITFQAASVSAKEWHPNDRVELSFIAASRGGYVFPGSDSTKIGNFGLVTGKSYGQSGKSHAVRPYGFEADGRFALGQNSHVGSTFRLVPMGLRLSPSTVEQDGFDGFLTMAYGFLPEIGSGHRLGFDLGLRLRRWQLESGMFPNTTHGGFVVAARFESPTWSALFEAGLMAAGFGTPESLGVQRDASSLRARVTYRFETAAVDISPWLEFFHTHRDFYGATLLAGERSLFVDEASLLLGIGVTL